MTESQEEIQTQEAQPTDGPQDMLDTLQSENQELKARLTEAQSEAGNRQDTVALLDEAETENQQLRSRLATVAAGAAVNRAAEQLGFPAAMARLHAHKFRCDFDADGAECITPDPVEFLQAELKRDPILRAAVDALAAHQRAAAAASGAVDVDKVDPGELLASLDRNPARKTRFIASHGVKAYLSLCDRARRC
jgi:hypothetical protein